ncbi:MAG TPA: homocysteine S-methyltransferase family protein [Bacillota bacterium]|jgi:5-methyltetrahydrofolate--homocysteine methyltransferase|nr:homocysteine S-methyltransferase family protein [Bacillota bacterium]HPT67994.1 homocysteine S-methyltransferase family protein [Bacillota bacterium]
MNKKEFLQLVKEKILVLDGAFGTELTKRGMPAGVCPEQWVLEHPMAIVELQREYQKAGSAAVYTCTFGANRLKLGEYGLQDRVVDMNRRLAELSRQALGPAGLVIGDLSSTGRFVQPFGDLPFEEAVEVFKEQVRGLLAGGVDLFVIETMMDIQEARAALLAVKESCDLPVIVTMTFNEDGRTLTGTDPVTALITLQSLGADAVGCNCSTGPEKMAEFIAAMKPYAKVPLVAKPNAGLPRLVDGKTVFDLPPEEFGRYVRPLIEQGVGIIGGCCGTSPVYIQTIVQNIRGMRPPVIGGPEIGALTSARKTVFLGFDQPLTIVGERINPTGKKQLQAELREGRFSEVRRFAVEQAEQGAAVLDVNVGMPGIDEQATMVKAVELLSQLVEAPLCIDSSTPEVIEAALRIYPGRALLNSISAERHKLERLLPVAARYGAMFILLPLSDAGVPATAEERCRLVGEVFARAQAFGYQKWDIIVDGLVMTVSADQKAAMETLKVIEWCSRELGCGTIIGLSNVSFGLPERSWINGAFLAMAVDRGLTMAIANPAGEMIMDLKAALDVLTQKDPNSQGYIHRFSQVKEERANQEKAAPGKTVEQRIYDAVLKGDREIIRDLLETALQEGAEAGAIVDEVLIPAINEVGRRFDRKEYYLPQLIQSAETMKSAFTFLEPKLVNANNGGGKDKARVKVVLATVKGDIHDIGKNIVALMLRNYNFEVHDLGKDVPAQDIIDKAKETGAQIIGLSALMTTTMAEMKEVIRQAKAEGLDCKFMIGGAVVNQQYAEEIGADGYAPDAYGAVKLAKRLAGQAAE